MTEGTERTPTEQVAHLVAIRDTISSHFTSAIEALHDDQQVDTTDESVRREWQQRQMELLAAAANATAVISELDRSVIFETRAALRAVESDDELREALGPFADETLHKARMHEALSSAAA